jgi:hypothetical protein
MVKKKIAIVVEKERPTPMACAYGFYHAVTIVSI